jgi:hypothetical protein
MNGKHGLTLLVSVLLVALCSIAAAQQYSWQKPHVKILPGGDLEWSPEPFELIKGREVRYIDYENGDDSQDGKSKQTAWKHHPWDREAEGKAAEASGPVTYVFKRGVLYRGQLQADESGKKGDPIRLTSDPDWGRGEAWLVGSVRLEAKWVKASDVQIPNRLAEPEKVWALDVKPLGILKENKGDGDHDKYSIEYIKPDGRGYWNPPSAAFTGLFRIEEGQKIHKLHLARDPDWQRGSDNFVIDYWHRWGRPVEVTDESGKSKAVARAAERLKGFPQDYFVGGFIWSQYPWFMGTPIARKIGEERKKGGKTWPQYVPEKGALGYGGMGGVKPNLRYMIENLPQYLDSAGEFYLDFQTGILYYRPEQGLEPNDMHLEIAKDLGTIQIQDKSHIEISGLKFSFAQGATVSLSGNTTDVNVHHCSFEHACQFGIVGGVDSRNPEFMDDIRIADCSFTNVWETAIRLSNGGKFPKSAEYGLLGHVDVLRNKIYNSGMRHNGNVQSNVPAISIFAPTTAEIAGNVVKRTFGSGIVVFGGKEGALGGEKGRAREIPLIRILVHHNETEDTALAVNDYGGLALWQGGPMYAYSNRIGNSPGHMPGGVMGINRPMNLSYPLYLDGAYKIYSFNNIIWGRTTDPKDLYHNQNSGYFMVFGFLNQFTNNTVYRQGKAIGGSSGNRCDILGNLFSEITDQFLANNRTGDPSLVGGGDDAASGIRGVPSLAFAHNVFYGKADAGRILEQRYDDDGNPKYPGIAHDIKAGSVEKMARQMQTFPIRFGQLGTEVSENPIVGATEPIIEDGDTQVSFRLVEGSKAVDSGCRYFIPWSLYATVGEWHFTENRAKPEQVVDYHWYMDEAHMHRKLYEQMPSFDLTADRADAGLYVASPSEDWAKGAMAFDGKLSASYPDEKMRQDIVINLVRAGKFADAIPEKDWTKDEPARRDRRGRPVHDPDDVARYPGNLRNTLIIKTQNLLMESNFRTDSGQTDGVIAGKTDGKSGYRLRIDENGKAVFEIASGGQKSSVASSVKVNDGQWHHVLAEVDRKANHMTIYVDGRLSGEAKVGLTSDASLDNKADFVVGRASEADSDYFVGAIDFLRVAQGTLSDAQTDIQELYEWQTNGPFTRDFAGNEPRDRRDAGALEKVD